MTSILLTIAVFGILIFVHEFGHFTVAKWAGVRVFEFSMGMGPKLFSFTKGETMYSLRLFPIGGFVRMAGEQAEDEEEEVEDERSLNKKSILVRMAILSAGSFMNLVLAAVLFIALFMFIGLPSNENIVGTVIKDKPAAIAGLLAGDRIIKVDNQVIQNWEDLVKYIHKLPNQKLNFTIARGKEKINLTITTIKDEKSGFGLIGIEQKWVGQGFFMSLWLGFSKAFEFTKLLLVALFQIIIGKIKPEFAGPVGVTRMVGQAAQYGMASIMSFTAIFSINLCILNLLPIPALDGSRVAFLLLEALRGKPLDPKNEGLIHLVGFALLLMLMIIVTYQDIMKIFS